MPAQLPGHIQLRGKTYYAVVEVPPELRAKLGRRRIVKTLRTKFRTEADRRLCAKLVEIHSHIEAAQRAEPESSSVWARAEALSEARKALSRGDKGGIHVPTATRARATWDMPAEDEEQLARETAFLDALEHERDALIAKGDEEAAATFWNTAMGTRVRLDSNVAAWLREPTRKGRKLSPKTAKDWERVVRDFANWAEKRGDVRTFGKLSARIAGQYVAFLTAPASEEGRGLSSSRVNNITTALSTYWQWCGKRGVEGVTEDLNPWRGKAPARAAETTRRPFTDAELVRLFAAEGLSRDLRDLMAMAALTGARIEELCSLTVGMCEGGLLKLPGTKSESAARTIPAHSALAPIIAARCEGRSGEDWLFPDLGTPQRGTGKRSVLIGRRFMELRRAVGVAEIVAADNGKPLDAVVFHSFRHWFGEKAESAGAESELVRRIMGHKPQSGDTLHRVYARNAQPIEPMRKVIEAVRLPEGVKL